MWIGSGFKKRVGVEFKFQDRGGVEFTLKVVRTNTRSKKFPVSFPINNRAECETQEVGIMPLWSEHDSIRRSLKLIVEPLRNLISRKAHNCGVTSLLKKDTNYFYWN